MDVDQMGRQMTSDQGQRFSGWGDKFVSRTGTSQGQQEVPLVGDRLGSEVYFAAAGGRHAELVDLLAGGGDPAWQDEDARTPLHAACRHNHANCAELLLDAGADCNFVARSGFNALMSAAYWGNLECVRLLLERGADTTHQCAVEDLDKTRTASEWASHYGNHACASLISSAERRRAIAQRAKIKGTASIA